MLKEDYIKKANIIHNGRYDYSHLPLTFKCTDKIPIICPEHGEFLMIARNHINNKQICPKCANKKRSFAKTYDFNTFVQKANLKHNNKYEYLKESYTKCSDYVNIICKKCGNVFTQQGTQHLNGCGCSHCNPPRKRLTNEEFIERLKKSHPNLELISEYDGDKNYVTVKCQKHNNIFQTKPNWLKRGCNCIMCYNEKRGDSLRHNIKDIINICNKIHNNKYEYPRLEQEYKNNKSKITIICPFHGEFKQSYNKHIDMKQGCPFCNESHMEKTISKLIPNANRQQHFEWLGQQSFDFYLMDNNIAIECQGEQHFKKIMCFGGEERFKKQIKLDENKYNLCKANNVKIYYIIPQKYYNLAIKNFNNIYNKENSLIFEHFNEKKCKNIL